MDSTVESVFIGYQGCMRTLVSFHVREHCHTRFDGSRGLAWPVIKGLSLCLIVECSHWGLRSRDWVSQRHGATIRHITGLVHTAVVCTDSCSVLTQMFGQGVLWVTNRT